MTESSITLVLGATGKTGSRVAAGLIARGLPVRTAARSGADVAFDWTRPDTWSSALNGVARIYLIPPVLRIDFAPDVAAFLDQAEAAGIRHVTFLSAYGMEFAPQGIATRDVEHDLIGRHGLSRTIVRPAWFMQDFSETFLQPIDDAIVVPTGDGAEAFVDVEDIAAVAVVILAYPSAHDGAEYAVTGPEALAVAEAAAIISDALGRPIRHVDPDRDAWLAAVTLSGAPEDYGTVLCQLTETVASGNGSVPTATVEKVTGRAPRRFAEFAARSTDAWTARTR